MWIPLPWQQNAKQPSRVTKPSRSSDHALGVVYDDEEQASLLPDGGRAASCYDCAYYIRSLEPKTEIYGFWSRENTSWAGAILQDGHDFAVVDRRYIVDPWIVETECLTDRAVFDLRDPADHAEVQRLYGDRRSWRLVESASRT
jgi:hypothetical protein